MSIHGTPQPAAKPAMSMNPEMQQVAKKAGTEYIKGLAKEGGHNTADYEQDNGQQQMSEAQQKLDDAKAQAQGMWAKYCGCFSGV